MKKMVLMMVLLMIVSACGGGGTNNTPAPSETPQATNDTNNNDSDEQENDDQASEEDNLPGIVDNYYDYGTFRYEDPSLYAGTYAMVYDPEDTCSDFFGIAMQGTMTLENVTMGSTDVTLEDVLYTYAGSTQEEIGDYDLLGYTGTYRSRVCAIVIGSYAAGNETYDSFGFACVTDDLSDFCAETYERTSDYDFSNVTIKNARSLKSQSPKDDSIFTAAALRLLRPSL